MFKKPLQIRLPDAALTLCAMSLLPLPASAVQGETPSLEQVWATVQAQRAEIERLKARNQQLERRLDATGDRVEQVAEKSGTNQAGGAPGRTHIGGYGELHYSHLDSKKEMDFHRFVLFFGHEFTDRLRFNSELEIEHVIASHAADDPGEVELEQAYVEYDLNARHSVKGGLFLMPVGILNETHEPTTFYGVERNPVEKNIVPTTWWEGGAALTGRLGSGGLSYDLALTSGLKVSAGDNYKVRNGRQKVAKADASDLAETARLRWTGMPGLELAATVQRQNNIGQGADPAIGGATLFEGHAVYQSGPFALRALYATWDLNGPGPASIGADRQTGWYIEPSYKVTPKLGVFARYNEWDNTAGAGSATDTRKKQWDAGMNYWLHENVVLKFDMQDQSGAASDDGVNLGIGYQF